MSDLAAEPLGMLGPVTGVRQVERLSLVEAALATGVSDMDAHGFIAAEHGETLAAATPQPLDADEAGALHLYTMESELYPTLNRLLRSRERQLLKPFFPYLKLLLLARDKLPKYSGTVWRGVKEDLRGRYPEGKTVYWWAFSSTTKKVQVLQKPTFLGQSGTRTQFLIEVMSGVDIEPYSGFQGQESEAEVLLYPGTKLQVVGTAELGAGLFQVHLKEVAVPVQLIK